MNQCTVPPATSSTSLTFSSVRVGEGVVSIRAKATREGPWWFSARTRDFFSQEWSLGASDVPNPTSLESTPESANSETGLTKFYSFNVIQKWRKKCCGFLNQTTFRCLHAAIDFLHCYKYICMQQFQESSREFKILLTFMKYFVMIWDFAKQMMRFGKVARI